MGTKPARNFGGRPVEREPEPGARVHLSVVVPPTLKRRVEQAAKKRGWSVSNEVAHRLAASFDQDVLVDVLRIAVQDDRTALGGIRGVRGLLADAVDEIKKRDGK
jgi:hypothetical protein